MPSFSTIFTWRNLYIVVSSEGNIERFKTLCFREIQVNSFRMNVVRTVLVGKQEKKWEIYGDSTYRRQQSIWYNKVNGFDECLKAGFFMVIWLKLTVSTFAISLHSIRARSTLSFCAGALSIWLMALRDVQSIWSWEIRKILVSRAGI